VRLFTATGVSAKVPKPPSPRCPDSPNPQHLAVPSARSAHANSSPAVTRVAVVMPLTVRSTEKSVHEPSPSCPNWFRPVHFAVPSERRTHVYSPPAETAVRVTVPPPWLKVAVTVLAALMVTVHVAPDTVLHPLQLAKVAPLTAVAVRVTLVPLLYGSEQSLPQLIPAGFELTLPLLLPVPVLQSVNWPVCPETVSVVLAFAPELSVAVTVVLPGFTPVARPAASIVATAVLLLAQVTPGPPIVTGVVELVLVPLPNWPHWLSPQHRTVPPPRSAQLWCHHPAVTPIAPVMPLTGTGVVLVAVLPFPSCPNWPCPQHWIVPFPRSAQVCRHPALTSTAPVSPVTCTGVVAAVVVPLPNCPKSFSPQHRTVPSLRTAHVWAPPPLTAATPLVRPLTCTDVEEFV
jgi:hypothetical protein